MTKTNEFPEVRDIANAVCEGTASEEQIAQLEQLLHGDAEAQRFYYDYINLHMQLSSATDRNMEFVYRRMTEEFVVRGKENSPINEISTIPQLPIEPNNSAYVTWKMMLIVITVLFLLGVTVFGLFTERVKTPFVAELVQGSVKVFSQGNIESGKLYAGDYVAIQNTTIKLIDGDTLHLEPDSLIKLFNNDEIRLKKGKLKLESAPNHSTIVHSRKFIALSNGSGLTLDLTQSSPALTTGQNTLIIPNRWRPRHFWTFDDKGDRVSDYAGKSHGIAKGGVSIVEGAVGRGASMFYQDSESRVDLGSGGGTAIGTGSFSVTDGITIEALIRPDYRDKVNEIGGIFQKDHGDGNMRLLLSFQHDSGQEFQSSKEDVKASLNFGLFILGQGYHELKLPLDGQEGRPALADLEDENFHHIVATYSVPMGIKAIYINGKRLASYQYPPGSKMLSGGPGLATIGNNPNEVKWNEAFSGAIDEVAFYDFALTDFTIKQHLQHIKQGRNYFGLTPSNEVLPSYIKWPLPANQSLYLDSLTGLPK